MKPIKSVVKARDACFQVRVIDRDVYCPKCGRPASVAHHIIHRRYYETRWDIENGIALCAEHHDWAHREPRAFKEWYENYKKCEHIQLLPERNKK